MNKKYYFALFKNKYSIELLIKPSKISLGKIHMKIRQLTILLGALSLSILGHATTWFAGSDYRGKVNIRISGGAGVTWDCNGRECQMSGPWGNDLSLESCQNLAAKVGELRYYGNSAGRMWSAGSAALSQCNQAATQPSHHETIWYAASSYRGKVQTQISGGAPVIWDCNGHECSMSGPWGNGLSLESCRNLVAKIGEITSYSNSAGSTWRSGSRELASCNTAAR